MSALPNCKDPKGGECKSRRIHNAILNHVREKEAQQAERRRHPDRESGRWSPSPASVLSPHTSVYEALNNPQLDGDRATRFTEPMAAADALSIRNDGRQNDSTDHLTARTDLNSIHQSQYQFQFSRLNTDGDPLGDFSPGGNLAAERNNLEFSTTSWQHISTAFQHNDMSTFNSPDLNAQALFSFNLRNENNSNIISSDNNSLYFKQDDNFLQSATPNRIDSPNVGSILSSSSDHDADEKKFTSSKNLSNNPNHSNSFGDSLLPKSLMLDFDSDTELENTVDSSTIISSFVMPRVSILATSNEDANNPLSNNKIKVRIVGHNNNILLDRFSSYKKIFNNIHFFTNQSEYSDLIILIVNKDNYMLPKITKSHCIPIILSRKDIFLTEKIPKSLKLCQPIFLNSLNDDLIVLIDFLNNIDDLDSWKLFLSSSNKNFEASINDTNSSLIEFQHENKSAMDNSTTFSKWFKSINGSASNNHGKGNKDKPNNRLFDLFNPYIAAGVAFGVISIGLIFIWKNITQKHSIFEGSFQIQSNESPSQLVSSNPSSNEFDETASVLDHMINIKIKEFTDSLECCADLIYSQTSFFLQKAKLALIELFSF